ncbi:MAG: hypothetical protein AB1427_15250, partial [Thermodesulfobacteriota bacterium]
MQKRWYTGNELVERWGIQPFELYEFMKNGFQAYTHHGKKIIDKKDCIVEVKPFSLESWEKIIRGKFAATSVFPVGVRGVVKPTDHEIKQLAKRTIEGQPKFKTIPPPPDCIAIDFSIPGNPTEANKKIFEALQYRFKATDVEAFEREHVLLKSSQSLDDGDTVNIKDQDSGQHKASKWITGKEIIEQYGVSSVELFDAIKTKGLEPHDPKTKTPFPRFDVWYIKKSIRSWEKERDRYPFWCLSVDEAEMKIKKLKAKLNTINNETRENDDLPIEPKKRNIIIDQMLKLHYKVEEATGCFSGQVAIEETSEKSSEQQRPEAELPDSILPCPPGTAWDKVQITIISHDTAKIITPKGTEKCSF